MTRLALALLVILLATPALAQQPLRRDPLRLVSLGDSVTEAINAEEFHPWKGLTENKWASWVNGYHKDWDERLGRTDVNSHNQRITELFGKKKRKNSSAAKTGNETDVLWKQAKKAVKKKADYVTILIGQNDVCGDDPSEIPSDPEFEANVRAGFDALSAGLPPGATIYTLAIIDIYRLWEISGDLEAFFGIECNELWELLASEHIPCATMLDPDLTDAERLATRERILGFNAILDGLVAEYGAADPQHYWHYSSASFDLRFEVGDVSTIDCFHPSAEGQEMLSADTWAAGPFAP